MVSQATKTTEVTSEVGKRPMHEGYQPKQYYFQNHLSVYGAGEKLGKKICSPQWQKIGNTLSYEVLERIKGISQ